MSLPAAIANVPAWNWALQGVGLVTAYVGAELNARMRLSGFYLWLVSNVVLAVLHGLAGLWLLLVLDGLFFRVNVLGIVRWSRLHPDQAPGWLRPRDGRSDHC
jgi:nicotinamide riboside transporter PnuC